MDGAPPARAAEDVHVLPRIDRDAGDLTEIRVGRKLEKVGGRVEPDLGDFCRLLLRARFAGESVSNPTKMLRSPASAIR